MNKKRILTSVIGICVSWNAFADPYPADSLLQPGTSYDGQGVLESLGVYSGSVVARAEYGVGALWDIPGAYVPANSDVAVVCPQGYYCPGSGGVGFNSFSNVDQGLKPCPSGYTSDEGAAFMEECYMSCEQEYRDNASQMSGKIYYGANTCQPAACIDGYHLLYARNSFAISLGMLGDPDRISSGDIDASDGYIEPDFSVLDNISRDNAWQFSTVQSSQHNEWAGLNNGLEIRGVISYLPGSTNNDTWIYPTTHPVYWDPSSIEMPDIDAPEDDESKKTNCYCQFRYNDIYTDFIYVADNMTSNTCHAKFCRSKLINNPDFLYAVIRGLNEEPSSVECPPNKITITWQDAEQQTIDDADAGWCEYNGEIRTPADAPHKPGKHFLGWVLDIAE